MDDSTLSNYYKALSNVKILNREEELVAYHAYKDGCEQAGSQLIESCLRLVFSIARSYWKDQSSETLKDLISAGNEGLLRSLNKFNPTKGVKFSTYTGYWILMYIRKYAVEDSKIVKPPIAHRRKAKLETELYSSNLVFKDLEDFKQVSDSQTPLEELETSNTEANNKLILDTLLRFLTTRERIIVEDTFGLHGASEHSLRSLGDKLNLSSERIRQIKTVALDKIRLWSPFFDILPTPYYSPELSVGSADTSASTSTSSSTSSST